MIKNSIFFGSNFNYKGNLFFSKDENPVLAEFEVSQNSIPKIRIVNSQDLKIILGISNDKIDFLKFKNENQIFTLVDNEIDWNYIYPKYILLHPFENLDDITFDGFHINSTYLLEWFITNNSSTSTSETGFVHEVSLQPFNVEIEYGSRKLKISNSYNCHSDEDEKQSSKIIIEELPTIDISCIDHKIGLEDIKTLNHDMNLIFSFLTGFPVTTKYLWGSFVLKNKSKKWVPIYFLNSFKENKKLTNKYEFLMNYNYLIINNNFIKVFENYYSKYKIDYFRKMWARLYGLLNYNDVWDYELLGYVSILDQYLMRYVKNQCFNENKISKKQFNVLKKSLNELARQLLKEQTEIVYLESINKQIDNIKNTTFPFFNDKFECLINNTDSDIKTIISFSSENFNFLKNLRNDIAHGNDIDYKNLDYANIGILQNKIVLLLFYLLYNDLGLSKEDFIQNLYLTFHYLKWNSKINNIHLDRITEKVKFITVNDSTFNSIRELKNFEIILEKTSDHDYVLDSKNTLILQNNSDKSFRDIRDYIRSLYNENEIKEMDYSSGYIENRETSEVVRIHGLCIIEK